MHPSILVFLTFVAGGLFFGFTLVTAGRGEPCPRCEANAVKPRHTDWMGRPDPSVADNPRRCIACGWPDDPADGSKRR